MIFVTVGTHDQGFNRLLQPMDALAAQIEERVVIQYGSSTYVPQNSEHFDFTSGQHMAQLTDAARVIVSHAGSGTIISCLNSKKPMVLVPRLQRFGEHINDHQLQLANEMAVMDKAIVVYQPTINSLREAILVAKVPSVETGGPRQLINAIRIELDRWQ